jgi:hypothetical protein
MKERKSTLIMKNKNKTRNEELPSSDPREGFEEKSLAAADRLGAETTEGTDFALLLLDGSQLLLVDDHLSFLAKSGNSLPADSVTFERLTLEDGFGVDASSVDLTASKFLLQIGLVLDPTFISGEFSKKHGVGGDFEDVARDVGVSETRAVEAVEPVSIVHPLGHFRIKREERKASPSSTGHVHEVETPEFQGGSHLSALEVDFEGVANREANVAIRMQHWAGEDGVRG